MAANSDQKTAFYTQLLICAMVFLAVLVVPMAEVKAQSTASATASDQLPQHVIDRFGLPPKVPTGDLDDTLSRAVDTVFSDSLSGTGWGRDQMVELNTIAESGDPRLVWLISDLMRFSGQNELLDSLAEAASQLLKIEFKSNRYWSDTTDYLIAWDIPAPPDYLKYKRDIFTKLVPGWDKIFVEGNIDWRHVSWGGVLIDDRAFDTTDEQCNCIPAADNPEVTDAKSATWLDDDDVVFGVTINGESRAYPRRIMEVREMVNDTLGGRDIGMPYCTLCGSAQVYLTDDLPAGIDRPVLRTSGLLIRSNKVMYDLTSYSVFDTFLGQAVTGPLAAKNIQLKQASVVTTDWGTWKKDHPDTTVLVESLALGRDFDFRNNRDADGPIFPVGDVDPRLSVHEDIIGVVTGSGTPVAFQRSRAYLALTQGETVSVDDIKLVLDGGGITAQDSSGNDIASHQAFWFAWSQFHPDTKLWPTL